MMEEKKLSEAARAMGRKGGTARAKSLTAEERSDIARKAAAKSAEVRSKKAAAKKKAAKKQK